MNPDLYAVLGVLPDAEDIVVTAAYRALAQRYHPDKWSGDPSVAHRRMAAINDAYGVLGDKTKRAAYDREHHNFGSQDFPDGDREEHDKAFSDALTETEERWCVAVSVFPDLQTLRSSLAQTSTSLAFSFVTILLSSRRFEQRAPPVPI